MLLVQILLGVFVLFKEWLQAVVQQPELCGVHKFTSKFMKQLKQI